MKIALVVVRVLLGLMYVASSVLFFLEMMPEQKLEGAADTFMVGIVAAGYLMPVTKVFELVCGIALVSGRFVPLATVVIFPITLNVFMFHTFLAPKEMLVGVVMLLANLFLAYANFAHFKSLLSIR